MIKRTTGFFSLQPVLRNLHCLNALHVVKKNYFLLCVDTVVARSAPSIICLRPITVN
jgi:hypothetical protein